jgi:hypothetical protein
MTVIISTDFGRRLTVNCEYITEPSSPQRGLPLYQTLNCLENFLRKKWSGVPGGYLTSGHTGRMTVDEDDFESEFNFDIVGAVERGR